MPALVWSEDANLQRELAGAAARFGPAQAFDPSGLPDQDNATIALGIAQAAKQAGATLVMVGSTKRGKDVGPRVAAALDWPFAADVGELAQENGWKVGRMVLSGNSKATYTMGDKAVLTALPKTFEPAEPAGAVQAAGPVPASKVKVVGRKAERHSDFDLGSAPIVVGVGRGFKQQADLKLAEELATCFPGGAVGCSRPIAADL